jgi:biotin carboxylase
MELINSEVLVQEYLKGDEYIVDTVSCRGKHYVCAIFKYTKEIVDCHPIYIGQTLLPAQGEMQNVLSHYAFKVLDVLDVKYGPSHIEIILTDKGPCLVELNARLDGSLCPVLIHECTGYGQVQLSVDSFIDEDNFFRHTQTPYQRVKSGWFLYLVSNKKGKIRSIRYLDNIKKLPSFVQLCLNVAEGGLLKKTVDLDSSPGHIKMAHTDAEVLKRDYGTIRTWEREGIFVLE